jgi:glycosyltransferase involved in cell wall biosynthesis
VTERVSRVSIGLPVFNGEPYLDEAIRSVLEQTFEDFELIIADNASTDGTADICRAAAARDRRVRVVRHASNVGASRNFSVTFELSRAPLFRWLAADDRLAPTCLERCVEALDRDPAVVLSHTDVTIVGPDGTTKLAFRYPAGHAGWASPSRRFLDVMRLDRWCAELFGLVRADVLHTRLMDRYVASDRILRAELALRGRFHIVPEPLFFNRDHPGRSVRALPAHHLRGEWFDPALANRRLLPHWRILREYARAIDQAPIAAAERWRCRGHLVRWLGLHMNWARLGADVVIATAPGSWRALMHAGEAAGRLARALGRSGPGAGS